MRKKLFKYNTKNESYKHNLAQTYCDKAQIYFILWEFKKAERYWKLSDSICTWQGWEWLKLELEFYHYAHYSNSSINIKAQSTIEKLLEKWFTSRARNLKANILKAINDWHLDRPKLIELATRISVNIDYRKILE